jgi:hypothetical protein
MNQRKKALDVCRNKDRKAKRLKIINKWNKDRLGQRLSQLDSSGESDGEGLGM